MSCIGLINVGEWIDYIISLHISVKELLVLKFFLEKTNFQEGIYISFTVENRHAIQCLSNQGTCQLLQLLNTSEILQLAIRKNTQYTARF